MSDLIHPLQRTLADSIFAEGVGLHTGQPACVAIHPAPADSGIVFRRTDLRGCPAIPARPDQVVETRRCTALGDGHNVPVLTVEHLLSALAGLGIDNALVEVGGPEIPVLDGSAAVWCELVQRAGTLEQQRTRRPLRLSRPVAVTAGNATAVAFPAESFKISLMLVNDHDHPALTDQYFEMQVNPEEFVAQVAPARTFGFLSEVEAMRRQGLIQGATMENAVVIGETDIITPLRFPDELVRHKALDLIGDLALLGPLEAHIVGVRTSHRLNNLLAKAILEAAI